MDNPEKRTCCTHDEDRALTTSKLPNSEDLLSQLRTLGARIMHRMLKVNLEAELKPWIEIQTSTLKSTNKMGNVPSWPIMDLQTVAGKLGRMYKT